MEGREKLIPTDLSLSLIKNQYAHFYCSSLIGKFPLSTFTLFPDIPFRLKQFQRFEFVQLNQHIKITDLYFDEQLKMFRIDPPFRPNQTLKRKKEKNGICPDTCFSPPVQR